MRPDLFSDIIVPLDGTEASERALPVAAALAGATGTMPTLVMVVSAEDHQRRAEELLVAAASRIGVRTATEVLVGASSATILLEHLDDAGSVVIMATHAHGAVSDLLLGSVTEEVVRKSPKPVVLVGPHAELPRPGTTYKDLVACIDSRDATAHLTPVVQACAVELGMSPWILQVVEPALPPIADVVETSYVQHAAQHMAVAGVELGWEVGHDSDAARGIVRFAESRSHPIIALATHGRDPGERLRASSTTVAVARHATCPVVVAGPRCATG